MVNAQAIWEEPENNKYYLTAPEKGNIMPTDAIVNKLDQTFAKSLDRVFKSIDPKTGRPFQAPRVNKKELSEFLVSAMWIFECPFEEPHDIQDSISLTNEWARILQMIEYPLANGMFSSNQDNQQYQQSKGGQFERNRDAEGRLKRRGEETHETEQSGKRRRSSFDSPTATNNKKGKGKKSKGTSAPRSATRSVTGDTRDENEEIWAIAGTTNIVNEKGLVTTNNKIPGVCRHYHSNGGCEKGGECAWRHFIPKEALECIQVAEHRARLR